MKGFSIVFLQAVVLLIGIIALTILIWFPLLEGRAASLDLFSIYADPVIMYVYVSSIAFFAALRQAFILLGYIRKNKVFSLSAVRTLKRIKYCALILRVLIVGAGLYIGVFHTKQDDPAGFLGLCMLTTFVCIIKATAGAIFEKLLRNAVEVKSGE